MQSFDDEACGAERSYTGPIRTSHKLVPDIDRKLHEDGARPIIYHWFGATCLQPELNGLTIMVNSAANGWPL